jgi:cysteine desulfurase
MKKIYLDYAATSPVEPQVLKAMEPYFNRKFGNPNSVHSWGQEARSAMEQSRKQVADFFKAQTQEIIFLSGATEANNLAVKGAVQAWQKQNPGKTAHLIVSPIEHHCVLDTVLGLKNQGIKITWLKTDKYGLVDLKQIKNSIQKNTVLVSVIFGNNEVGTIQPILKIGEIIKNVKNKQGYPYFHTDAVQAVQYLKINVKLMAIDLFSASAHKFYGPKGVGFLFCKKGVSLNKQLQGGSQEHNLRAGTENVPGIIGLAKALELIKTNNFKESQRLKSLRDDFIEKITTTIPKAKLTGHSQKRLPHIASFVMPGAEGEAMLLHLDSKGIAASSGSACTSGKLEPSHVLLSMGVKPEAAHSSLRFSLGKNTNKRDLEYTGENLAKIVKTLRQMNPLYKA